MKAKKFIKEIKRRFPSSDIDTLKDALDSVKNTEYEYIFSAEIRSLQAGK